MSRKHNTRHNRTRSNYPARLEARGVSSASVRMRDLDTLRTAARQLDNPEHGSYNPGEVEQRERAARVQLRKGLWEGPRPYAIPTS